MEPHRLQPWEYVSVSSNESEHVFIVDGDIFFHSFSSSSLKIDDSD